MPPKLWLLIGGGVLGLGLAILSTWLLMGRGPAHDQDAHSPHVDNPPISGKLAAHVDAGWIKQVAALPAAEQVKEVARMMQVLNPTFDGVVKPTLERNTVTGLEFLADNVSDLAPLKALPHLNDRVTQGDPIGVMGHTGEGIDRERAHLHLELNLLLNADFDRWSAKYFPRDGNRHGIYNGQNLDGLDIGRFYLELNKNPRLTVPQFLQEETTWYRALITAVEAHGPSPTVPLVIGRSGRGEVMGNFI